MSLPMTTPELAQRIRRSQFTIRARVRRNGDYFGIVPDRLPGGGYLWPSDTVERLLEAGKQSKEVAA